MQQVITMPFVSASSAPHRDATEFTSFVEKYQGLVCAVAFSATGDRAVSEEVAQEAFLVAWNKLPTLATPPAMPGWVCGIARNLALNVRRRRRETELPTGDTASTQPSALDNMLEAESRLLVQRALDEIPDTYREPLVLFYRSEQSIAEVASGLGISEDAAKKRLSRGRNYLKESIHQLVERTLDSSRPGKAFTASVVGAYMAADAGVANAGAQLASTKSAGVLVPALLAAALIVGGGSALVVWSSSSGSSSSSATPGNQPVAGKGTSKQPAARDTTASRNHVVRSGTVPSLPAPADLVVGSNSAPSGSGAAAAPTPGSLEGRAELARPIDYDFAEADVHNMLSLLSDVMDIPIVVKGDISAVVTLRGKKIHALDALDNVLEQAGAVRTEIPAMRIVKGDARSQARQLSGQPISQSFSKQSLQIVLTALESKLDMPLIIADGVDVGPVSIEFDATPPGVALELLLQQTGLGLESSYAIEVRPDPTLNPQAED